MLQAKQTLVMIVGASVWPRCNEFEESISFRNSALVVQDYLTNEAGLGIPKDNLLFAFDRTDEATVILRDARSFLKKERTNS